MKEPWTSGIIFWVEDSECSFKLLILYELNVETLKLGLLWNLQLRLMGMYTILSQEEQSEGRIDCIVETLQYVYIFEFKLDGTAAEALQQIEEKDYARSYAADAREVVRIGGAFLRRQGRLRNGKLENKRCEIVNLSLEKNTLKVFECNM